MTRPVIAALAEDPGLQAINCQITIAQSTSDNGPGKPSQEESEQEDADPSESDSEEELEQV